MSRNSQAPRNLGTGHRAGWSRFPSRAIVWHNAAGLLALWGLAVALPLLDLFGRNPTFFVFNGSTRFEILLFACSVAVVAPLCVALLDIAVYVADEATGRVFHSALVWLLGTAFVLSIARHLQWNSAMASLGVAGAVGVLVALAERSESATRRALQYLSTTPILAIVMFVVFSPSATLLWTTRGESAAPVPVAHPASVVMLVFDEFPLFPLLGRDGTINEQRFPQLARLARMSSWFRNATSISAATQYAIGGMLTGLQRPASATPTTSDYPRNLFTLVGGTYRMEVDERFAMCPQLICAPPPNDGHSSLESQLSDATIVYGHLVVPTRWQALLPSISNSWGHFLTSDEPGPNNGPSHDVGIGLDGPNRVRALIGRIRQAERPTLYYTHTVFPHYPWDLSRGGIPYRFSPDSIGFTVDAHVGQVWKGSEFLVRQGLQRLMLELGHLDTLVGQLVDHLQAEGMWDETVLIVTADHGSSFQVGRPRRAPTAANADEIYRVPLFIKAPHQRTGEIRDDGSSLIDIVPTLVDLLGIQTEWKFDGRSLVGHTVPPASRPLPFEDGPQELSTSIGGLMALATRTAQWYAGEDWTGLFGVGPYGSLIGRHVDDLGALDTTHAQWFINEAQDLRELDRRASSLPLLLSGVLELNDDAPRPSTMLVAVNGRIAGVGGQVGGDHERVEFVSLIDETTLSTGSNSLDLFMPTGPPSDPTLVRAQPSDRGGGQFTVESGVHAGSILTSDDGRTVIEDNTGDLRIYVDTVGHDGGGVQLIGWAGNVVTGEVPRAVVAFIDEQQVAVSRPMLSRPDVAAAIGLPQLGRSGYYLNVPALGHPAEIGVAAVFDQRSVATTIQVP